MTGPWLEEVKIVEFKEVSTWDSIPQSSSSWGEKQYFILGSNIKIFGLINHL